MKKGARRFLAAKTGLLLLSLAFTPGCTTTAQDAQQASQKPLIWPQPPEPARISYVRSIERPQDIGANKGFFKKLAEFLLGATYDEIIRPYGVAVDSKGRLIVADTALKRIHVFDIAKNSYTYIDKPGESSFDTPIGAALDSDDNIYVTDSGAGKVYVFSARGDFKFDFEAGKRPTGIALNKKEKKLYVVDTGLHTLKIFDLKGNSLKTIGKWGPGPGEFNHPVDICVDKNGDLYVADTMNYRIQIFDKDGNFLTNFGRHGDGTGDFGRPKGVAVDNEGNIYVADAIFDTVQIFNRNGNFLLNFGSLGREAGAFWIPAGMFIDGSDKIYIADSFNKRVQVFEYIGG